MGSDKVPVEIYIMNNGKEIVLNSLDEDGKIELVSKGYEVLHRKIPWNCTCNLRSIPPEESPP